MNSSTTLLDGPFHEHPGAQRAALAAQRPGRAGGGIERLVEVGIGEQDVGCLAAELEGEFLERVRAALEDFARRGTLAGECDLVDAGMGDQMIARTIATITGDDIDHARRETRPLRTAWPAPAS